MGKLERKTQEKDIILMAIVVFLFIVLLLVCLKGIIIPNQKANNQEVQQSVDYTKSTTKKNNSGTEQISTPKTDEEVRKYLSTLGEKSRIEYYCGEYIKCLKNKDYEKAYNMLYSEFKQKYFQTLDEYEEYVEKIYPNFFAVQYDDFSRQGDIYVIRLIIIDPKNSEKSGEENSQRIVIKENDFNDYVISFQVK